MPERANRTGLSVRTVWDSDLTALALLVRLGSSERQERPCIYLDEGIDFWQKRSTEQSREIREESWR